jgi:hypothetical protein
MHPQLTRFSGSSLRLLLSVIYLLLTLSLAGCSSLDSSSSAHTSTPTTSITRNVTPTTANQTATASETSTPTAAPTQGGSPPTATAASAPVPFNVTGVAFGAWPGDHQGECRTNTFFENTFARGAHHSSDHLSSYLPAPGAEYKRHGFADPRLHFSNEDLQV